MRKRTILLWKIIKLDSHRKLKTGMKIILNIKNIMEIFGITLQEKFLQNIRNRLKMFLEKCMMFYMEDYHNIILIHHFN